MTIQTERVILNKQRNVSLVTMIQSVGGEFDFQQRPGIVILPGGGYSMCSDREAESVAYPYLAAGFHAFVLRYSVGDHRTWPNPLNDYDQAMEYLLSHAEDWGLAPDKIAVIGFSAGGHLAGSAATLAKHRPAAAILCYAALEQDIASACQPGTDIPSPTAYVDERTPPCFLTACRDDPVVPMRNTLNFMTALEKFGTTYECHIYPYGGHGYSTALPHIATERICDRAQHWVQESIGFLWNVFGKLGYHGFEKPVCLTHISGNYLPYLSTQCTISHLYPKAKDIPVLEQIFTALEIVMVERFGSKDVLLNVLGNMKLSAVLETIGKTAEDLDGLDTVLNQIPNRVE